MKKVIAIVGPTGVGKSDISLRLAKQFNNEIISGDSVQVYKKLDIGSAKLLDTQWVTHHLIDILEPNEEYSVCDFQNIVRSKIEEIDRPLIVGGTGLYVKAALYNYEFDGNKRDFEFEKQYDNVDNEKIYDELMQIEPNSKVDKNNRNRLLRALMMAKMDMPLSSRNKKDEPLYDDLIITLNADRDVIYDRINRRVLKMIDEGLVSEVKGLLEQNIRVKAIGYSEIYEYLDGKISLEEAISLIQKNTRHYAKRQLTWFKNQMNTVEIDAFDNAYDKISSLVDSFYKTEVRKADISDLDEIKSLLKDVLENMRSNNEDYWNELYPKIEDFKNDILNGDGLVITYLGKVAGYIKSSTNNDLGIDNIGDYYLGRLMVSPHIRKSFLATILFNYCFRRFKGKYVMLVDKKNLKAQAFYDKIGFVKKGLVKQYNKDMYIITRDVK